MRPAGRPVPMTPAESRTQRIRQLSVLIARASTELEQLLALDLRVKATRDAVLAVVPPEVEPSAAPAAVIRRWAVAQGLIRPGMCGRLSNEVRTAYAAAGEPA